MSMKNSDHTIGNRTRDLPACSVVVYKVMGKNVVNWLRSQMTVWRTVYWVPKDTSIHSEYLMPIAFLLQQWL
jgi:hypothetical protein